MGVFNAIMRKIVIIILKNTKILLRYTGNIFRYSQCDNVRKMVLTVSGSVV